MSCCSKLNPLLRKSLPSCAASPAPAGATSSSPPKKTRAFPFMHGTTTTQTRHRRTYSQCSAPAQSAVQRGPPHRRRPLPHRRPPPTAAWAHPHSQPPRRSNRAWPRRPRGPQLSAQPRAQPCGRSTDVFLRPKLPPGSVALNRRAGRGRPVRPEPRATWERSVRVHAAEGPAWRRPPAPAPAPAPARRPRGGRVRLGFFYVSPFSQFSSFTFSNRHRSCAREREETG